jgi:hypothetical protein
MQKQGEGEGVSWGGFELENVVVELKKMLNLLILNGYLSLY